MQRIQNLAIAALALSGIAASATGQPIVIEEGVDARPAKRTRQRGAAGKSYKVTGSIALGNRHGGPHLNKREIARRQRVATRLEAALAEQVPA